MKGLIDQIFSNYTVEELGFDESYIEVINATLAIDVGNHKAGEKFEGAGLNFDSSCLSLYKTLDTIEDDIYELKIIVLTKKS